MLVKAKASFSCARKVPRKLNAYKVQSLPIFCHQTFLQRYKELILLETVVFMVELHKILIFGFSEAWR